MKYVITKDGRILKIFCESISMMEKDDGCTYYGENTVDFETSLFLPKSSIAEQSDNLEDLCDGLIMEEKGNERNWFVMDMDDLKNLTQEDRQYQLKDWNFNAFIKTDKGLIYVAKMNEKGELELL